MQAPLPAQAHARTLFRLLPLQPTPSSFREDPFGSHYCNLSLDLPRFSTKIVVTYNLNRLPLLNQSNGPGGLTLDTETPPTVSERPKIRFADTKTALWCPPPSRLHFPHLGPQISSPRAWTGIAGGNVAGQESKRRRSAFFSPPGTLFGLLCILTSHASEKMRTWDTIPLDLGH